MKSNNNILFTYIPAITLALFLVSCVGAGKNDQGTEYAPNMYHSVPYDPLKQITDKDAGMWASSIEDGQGEFYNSNPLNPSQMNERVSVSGTVSRTKWGRPLYNLPADSINYAEEHVKNPLNGNNATMEKYEQEGAILYGRMCAHCHGGAGKGDGKVGKIYGGVPNYTVPPYKNYTEGRIFHVITHGKGRMGAHGSQISEDERWKIVLHVQQLQKG